MAPRSFITDEITLEEKDRLLENFFAIRNTLRQQRLKKQGGMTSWTLGFVKGKVDYIYIKMSRLKGREKLFSEILAHVIDAYSNRKLPVEERQMWLGNTVIRRMIRRLYRFLAPWYLQERDSKGRFINPVQNFHMKNGAIPGDILLFGATEMDRRPIWGYTAGGLCCIRYVYPNNEAERLANANKYLEDVKEFVQRGREK
jgi:hypothetical protein